MRNQKGSVPAILIVVIVLIIAVVGGVSWFIVSQDSNTTNSSVVNTNTNTAIDNTNSTEVTNTNSVVTNETDNWMTYANNVFGYSFRYPNSFSIEESDNKVYINPNHTYPAKLGLIQVYKDTINNVRDILTTEYLDEPINDGTPFSDTNIYLNSIEASKLKFGTAIGLNVVNVLIEKDGMVYRFEYGEGTDLETFEKILNTFSIVN